MDGKSNGLFSSLRRSHNKKGVTILELAVVLVILTIMASVLLPAILASRESVRRAACTDHLRQIGIALTNFEQQNRALPRSRFLWSQLASQLEISTHIDEDWGAQVSVAPPILKCPSEIYSGPSEELAINYFVNIGSAISPPNGFVLCSRGVSTSMVRLTFGDFTDGLSNTATFSEHLQLQVHCEACHPSTRFWQGTEYFSSGKEKQLREYLDRAWSEKSLIPRLGWLSANTWVNNDFEYDHLWRPNQAMVVSVIGHVEDRGPNVHSPSSGHQGGVNVLFADGSLRFVVDQIDGTAWSAIGSRNGGEVNSVD
jgi:prepilin-type processing-associated H-X9-DG protein